MKVISDKVTMAIATALHSFDLLPTTTFEETQEKLSDDAVIRRYRNDHVFHAKVCSLTASVLRSVGDDIATLTRQRDLAVEAASDAATSLETIQLRSFGEESYLDSKPQMRAFAGARAKIARDIISTIKESEVMAQGEKGV